MKTKTLQRGLLASFGIIAMLALTAVWAAGTLLSAPARTPIGNLPADLKGREVEFASESGANIRGWLLPGEAGGGAVVLMHGVRGSRLSMLSRARFLSATGYTVLLFDFQAHGESTGERITTGYLESRDARAATNYVRAAYPDERVGVIGVSMGGAAVLLSSPSLDLQALVLEEVYPTIEEAVSNRIALRLGGWAGALAPLLTWQLRLRLGVGPESLRPVEHIGESKAPIFVIAGAEDRHTTLEESRQLFGQAAEPKEFWAVEGAGHTDLHALEGDEYERRVLSFLKQHLGR